MSSDVIVGLDIGSSNIRVVVAIIESDAERTLRVIGLGSAPSEGIEQAVVTNIEAAVGSIQKALKEAEQVSQAKVTKVVLGMSGAHLKGENSEGKVVLREQEVTPNDVKYAVDAAKAVAVAADKQLIMAEPQAFFVGDHRVREPVGMSGSLLVTHVHMVFASNSPLQNMSRCVRRCGLEVMGVMPNIHADSLATLTADEKDLGVALVNIGGGTTDVVVFANGAIRHTAVIPIAGNLITHDLQMALQAPRKEAEDIKLQYGCAKQLLANPDILVEVSGIGGRATRTLNQQALSGVIEPRVEEIFLHVNDVIQKSACQELLSSGIVLTGGAAAMPGMVELGEEIFFRTVRRGYPQYRGALHDLMSKDSAHTTVMGLLQATYMHRKNVGPETETAVKGLMAKARKWFEKAF